MTSIYLFDNHTGKDLPNKIDVFDTAILLGASVSEVVSAVDPAALMFCVFTDLGKDVDFVVQDEDDKESLSKILSFGGIDAKILVKDKTMWTSKAKHNLIVGTNIDISGDKLATMLGAFISAAKNVDIAKGKTVVANELYSVYNVRSGNVLYTTPNFGPAKSMCDKNPCCVVMNKVGNVVYNSKYGKVKVPYTHQNTTALLKQSMKSLGKDGAIANF